MSRIYETDMGIEIIADTRADLTGAAAVSIHYRPPTGAAGQWAGTVHETTKVRYVTAAPLMAGRWYFQAGVTNLGGWTGRGRTFSRTIYPVFT